MTKLKGIRLWRVGGILLVIGVSLLAATILRNRVLYSSEGSFPIGLFGPYLLEPRETVVVLREVNPAENVTLMLVNEQSWRPPESFDEANACVRKAVPAFEMTGLRKFDAVLFNVDMRGLYYVLVTTGTGEFTGETEVVVEQRGLAADFWWFSWAFIAVGVAAVIVDKVRLPKGLRR